MICTSDSHNHRGTPIARPPLESRNLMVNALITHLVEVLSQSVDQAGPRLLQG